MSARERQQVMTKTCGCGRAYTVGGDWEQLAGKKVYSDDTGALCEQRVCAGCMSHITIERVRAMTTEELRRAVRVIDRMRESFNQEYTAQELLRLMVVCWACDWDVLPDEWTAQQCGEALAHGAVPRFAETSGGLHALGVTDCRCRACRRAREKAAEDDGVESIQLG